MIAALALLALAQFPVQFEVRGGRPEVFVHAGERSLVFELYVTNWDEPITLDRITVGASDGQTFKAYDADGILAVLPGWAKGISHGPVPIGTGLSTSMYFWVDLGRAAKLTDTLQVHLDLGRKSQTQDGVVTWTSGSIDAEPPIVVAPPVRGDRWVALNGPSNTTGHRRAEMILDGGFHIAQRFAIDFLEVNTAGETHEGDPADNKNYLCYGKPALAVADGVVVLTHDGVVQNVPGKMPPISLDTLAGNHVGIQIGPHRYAMYAHLIPGSLKVKVGDHVKAGDTIGLIGNSGNSSEPHLHFQVVDAPKFLVSEGVPFALDTFFLHDSLGVGPVTEKGHTVRGDTLIENQVVDFRR